MDNAQILSALRGEKEQLELQCRGAQARIEQLRTAISALEGRTATTLSEGPSVLDMILGAAEKVGEGGTVFDYASLLIEAAKMFPAHKEKLKRGLYTSVARLVKTNKMRRAPGGFQRVL